MPWMLLAIWLVISAPCAILIWSMCVISARSDDAITVMSPQEFLGLEIHVLYAGAWSFAVQPTEDTEGDWCDFPEWPIRRTWGGGRGYSELLEIDVPDDATIVEKERK